jgi:hypothetical protein
MPTLDDVRKDHSIQVADMRGSIDVEYRCGDVVWLLDRRLGGDGSPIAIVTNLTGRIDPWRAPRKAGKHLPECRNCCIGYSDVHTFMVVSRLDSRQFSRALSARSHVWR